MIIIIPATISEVSLDEIQVIAVSEETAILVDGALPGEHVVLYREGASGDYVAMTDDDRAVYLSAYPNLMLIKAEGNYKVTKDSSENPVSVSYQNVTNLNDVIPPMFLFYRDDYTYYLPLI